MNSKESEYRELFLIEAKDNLEQLDKLFIDLEKDSSDARAIKEVFRITHTLKGNAMGMGFDAIGELSHVIEDVMLAIQEGTITLDRQTFGVLFRANDKLGSLIKAVETGEKVSYLGIKTSLSLLLEKKGQKEEKPRESEKPDQENTDKKPEVKESQLSFADVIQVPVKKLDELLNDVGQLIIERDRLINNSVQSGIASSQLDQLKRITSNLQYSIMGIRMVQVGFLFNKFHRVLRDAATIEGKNVNLTLKGTETEVDRNVLKIITDSLVHLVRNSVSHGIESGEERKALGKPETGEVVLNAAHERDRVIISVTDDGGGIDPERIRERIVERKILTETQAQNLKREDVLQYIFEAGFSNAKSVNEISGRGVGMDVVKRTVESISGQVKIQTEKGKGTTIELYVPASLALKGTLIFMLNNQEYAIPLSYTEAVISVKKQEIHKVGSGLTTVFADQAISVIFLKDIFQLPSLKDIAAKGTLQQTFNELPEEASCEILVVSYGNRLTGIVVDKVIQQKEVIEKPLPGPLSDNKLISGAAILGNGNVSPVLDVSSLSSLIHRNSLQTSETSSK